MDLDSGISSNLPDAEVLNDTIAIVQPPATLQPQTTLLQPHQVIPSIADFATKFKKYPVIYTYHLVRDLLIKADSTESYNLAVIDGYPSFRVHDYVVLTQDNTNGKKYVYISFLFEDNLDLNWMYEVSKLADIAGYVVVLCVHSIDGIM